MEALRKALRNTDFYRKVPRDLTEASVSGSVFSICGAIVIVMLFVLELRAYLTVTDKYDVIMADAGLKHSFADQMKQSELRVNFNVSFPHLPCKFASVDVTDVTHTRRLNISRNLAKWKLLGSGAIREAQVGYATEKEGEHEVLDDDHPIHQRLEDHSTLLDESTFDAYVKNHDVVLVNFFAPWCHWCKKLEPVWEHTASELNKKNYKNTVRFAKVDCTKSGSLCQRHVVRAYPTILPYQHGEVDMHKPFNGPRTTKNFLDFVEHLDTVSTYIKENRMRPKKTVTSKQGNSEGCMIAGFVMVNRVPGSLIFTAHSEWHDFDPDSIDVSHVVHSFSFGNLANVAPGLMKHMSTLDGIKSDPIKDVKRLQHHHYLKIVETWFNYRNEDPLGAFQFTKHSHRYSLDEGSTPQAKFQYDISPMAVAVSEESMATYQFITNACAIIGGVFTVLGLVDGVVYHGYRALAKKTD